MRLRPVFVGLLFAGAGGLMGQAVDEGTAEIQQALGLSSAQVREFEDLLVGKGTVTAAQRAWTWETYPVLHDIALGPGATLLSRDQRDKLAAVAKVLSRYNPMRLTIKFGLVDDSEWPGGYFCAPPIPDEAIGLRLSAGQLWKLRDMEARRPGRTGSPAEMATDRNETLAILNPEQQHQVEFFRAELKLAREAVGLGLICFEWRGDVLCH